MRRSPVVNLEFALMGDGVPVDEVYALLDTDAGIARAFRKLDTIKDDIVWWEAGAQPPQMLADGEVAMSTAYNGRIFNAQVLEEQPFVIVGTARYSTPATWPSPPAPRISRRRAGSSPSPRGRRPWPAWRGTFPMVPRGCPRSRW